MGSASGTGHHILLPAIAQTTDSGVTKASAGAPWVGTRTVTLSPAAYQHGEALITLTVKDGTDSTGYQFKLKVNPVNDAPSFDMAGNVEVLEDAAVAGSGYTVVETAGGSKVTHAGWATHISAMPEDILVGTVVTDISATAGDESQTQSFDNTSFGITTTGIFSDLFSVAPVIVIDASDATNIKGDLIYTLAPDANTAAGGPINVTATLTDGGTHDAGAEDGPGGINTGKTPHSFSITVIAVNDKPSFVKGGSQHVADNAGAQ